MSASGKIPKAAVESILKWHSEGLNLDSIHAELRKKYGLNVTKPAIVYHLNKHSPKAGKPLTAKRSRTRIAIPDYVKAAAFFLVNERDFTKEKLHKFLKKHAFPVSKDSLRKLYWLKEDAEAMNRFHHNVFQWPSEAIFQCPWQGIKTPQVSNAKTERKLVKTTASSFALNESKMLLQIKEAEIEAMRHRLEIMRIEERLNS